MKFTGRPLATRNASWRFLKKARKNSSLEPKTKFIAKIQLNKLYKMNDKQSN